MLNIKLSQTHLLGLGLTVALMSVTTTPAAAEVKIIGGADFYGVSQPPTVGNFIYGSPIATPVPVNPMTGQIPSRTHTYYSNPPVQQHERNTILVNPVLVNPRIRNSTLINPTIIRDSWYTPADKHIILYP